MRKILFRGKATRTKWVYGDLIHDRRKNRVYIWSEESELIEYIIKPETAGQYTGLLDKNGEKIFEGDIVKDSTGHEFGHVEFCNGSWMIFNDELEEFLSNWSCHAWSEELGPYIKAEIVGNIYDNPELLGGNDG